MTHSLASFMKRFFSHYLPVQKGPLGQYHYGLPRRHQAAPVLCGRYGAKAPG